MTMIETSSKAQTNGVTVEDIPDAIELILAIARDEYDRRDETQCELIEALNIAWVAAERWRIERSKMLMCAINPH